MLITGQRRPGQAGHRRGWTVWPQNEWYLVDVDRAATKARGTGCLNRSRLELCELVPFQHYFFGSFKKPESRSTAGT